MLAIRFRSSCCTPIRPMRSSISPGCSGRLGLAVGVFLRGRSLGGGVEDGLGSVGGGEGAVGDGPAFGVGYCSGRLGCDVEVVEAEVVQGGVGVGADAEGALRSGGLDVPEVDVGEVGEALVVRDGGREGDPVWRYRFGGGPGGEGGVAVAGVPVHGDADGNGYALEGEVVDADVPGVASAG